MGLRALFFDAGNTLLFPDTERTLASLIARGIRPTEDQLRTAERAVREFRDHHTGPSNPNHSYWNVYFDQLFSALALAPDQALQEQLIASSHRSTNWRRILPGTRDTLLGLKQQYRLAVISNSDGGIREAISAAGIGDCSSASWIPRTSASRSHIQRSSTPRLMPCRFRQRRASVSATSTP